MAIEIKAPTFPESVADGTVATWHKKPGDVVKRDELIVDIETDKVVIEVLAEADGVLAQIIKNEGDTVLSNELLGTLGEGGAAAPAPAVAAQAAAPAAAAPAVAAGDDQILSPAARKIAEENGIDPNSIAGTGKGGRVTKEDVVAAVEAKKNAPAAAPAAKPAAPAADAPTNRVASPITRSFASRGEGRPIASAALDASWPTEFSNWNGFLPVTKSLRESDGCTALAPAFSSPRIGSAPTSASWPIDSAP